MSKSNATTRRPTLRLVEPLPPDDPIDAALAELPPREAMRAIVRAHRVALDAHDCEMRRGRAQAERLLADVEAWIDGNERSALWYVDLLDRDERGCIKGRDTKCGECDACVASAELSELYRHSDLHDFPLCMLCDIGRNARHGEDFRFDFLAETLARCEDGVIARAAEAGLHDALGLPRSAEEGRCHDA